jgi:hypothetical protein
MPENLNVAETMFIMLDIHDDNKLVLPSKYADAFTLYRAMVEVDFTVTGRLAPFSY